MANWLKSLGFCNMFMPLIKPLSPQDITCRPTRNETGTSP
tara:strand:- start:100969 stop:101088 length:120 start_codon:yes stop_codon:yes gene_type:complete